MISATPTSPARNRPAAFGAGTLVGVLGGLVGLGGAEFRLPLLIGPFRFPVLEAVILNKAMSLVVVATALPFRAGTVPLGEVADHWPVVLNLLAGSLLGAWLGAGWATRLRSDALYRVIAVLLVAIALVLVLGHGTGTGEPLLTGAAQAVAGVAAGLAIGAVASLLGVAGGELLIPTLVILWGADVKLAGSLSLAVSLPTMLVGFVRYSQDRSFAVLGRNRAFLVVMAAGSVVGTLIGGLLLGVVPGTVLLPVLAAILLVSAWKVWGHGAQRPRVVHRARVAGTSSVDHSRLMESSSAIAALAALAQPTRLDAFRLLVAAEPLGLPAGEIARRLDVPPNTMSAHLATLSHAGLVAGTRASRSIIYRADLGQVQALTLFLLKNCCGGNPGLCAPVVAALASCCGPMPASSSRSPAPEKATP